MEREPADNQFTIDELRTIHEALVFTLNSVEGTLDIPPFNKMDAVLSKVNELINRSNAFNAIYILMWKQT
ncbi:MAG TPA: hypothetical protein VH500_18145 [Nitrososphaeraceae archaeon]|jgi:hypothetical protein